MEKIVVLEYHEKTGKFHYNYGRNRFNPEWVEVHSISEPISETTAMDFIRIATKLYFNKGKFPDNNTIVNAFFEYKSGQLQSRIQTEVEKLYIIWAKGTNNFKIGVSKNPKKRLATIQTGCPHECRLLYSFIPPLNEARQDEKIILEKYFKYKSQGEWLTLSRDSLVGILYTDFEMRNYITEGIEAQLEKIVTECFNHELINTNT